jgi:antitoxin component YwqK of YwqJK toxin-antitoxin module
MPSSFRKIFALSVFVLLTINGFSSAFSDTLWNQTDENGWKQGLWKKDYPNGNPLYKGYFLDNKPVGKMLRFYDDGNLRAELIYIEKSEITYASLYFKNAQKGAEGKYNKQMRDSIWNFYSYYTGYLSYRESYVMGLKDGPAIKYYSAGGKAEVIFWKDDLKSGQWKQYYEDSTLRLSSQHVMNKIHGPYKVYNRNNILMLEGSYLNGSQDGEWKFYDEEGNLLRSLSYKEGEILDKEEMEKWVKEFVDEIEKNNEKIPEPDFDNFFERKP